MAVLGLIFIVITIIALIGIGFLFGARNESAFRTTAIILFAFIIMLTMMHVSSLPENYTVRIFLAYAIGAIAMIGLAFMRKSPIITKITISVALFAHIAGIFMI